MAQKLKEKYGLFTAIALVIGIIIGSGVFFKTEKVLEATGGDLALGILAWAIGGGIMIICAYAFSILAGKYSGVNGIVDYAEAMVGRPYAYLVSWFTTFILFPSTTSVLAWVSARYVGVLVGWSPASSEVMVIAFAFLVGSYALNTLAPILSGRFQLATTIIKLIPLVLMAIIGTVSGIISGMTVENFTTTVKTSEGGAPTALLSAVVAAAFAYEGWIIATSLNAEIKNSKKNLPIALMVGTGTVALVYVFYYTGLSGVVSTETLMESGENGARFAFERLFGRVGGVGLFVLVIVSCLGTLNGLMLAMVRGMYSIGVRNYGPRPKMMSEINESTNIPTNSAIAGLLICMLWLVFYYATNLAPTPWFGAFGFDSSELPVVTVYAMYVPIIFMMMIKEKALSPIKRIIVPSVAIICCVFMAVAAVFSHKIRVVWYLTVFAAVMLLSVPFYKKKTK